MNTKTISLALKAILPWVVGLLLPVTATAFEGSGTKADPYLVKKASDFRAIADNGYASKYFRLANDINMGSLNNYAVSNVFRGTFDGNGHFITNYNSQYPLFKSLNGGNEGEGRGVVRNLIIRNSSVGADNHENVGIIAETNNGSIINCQVKSSSVTGSENVGGLVGENKGLIDSCGVWASTTITGKKHVGGVAGKMLTGSVQRTYFNGVITANDTFSEYGSDGIGGIVGFMERGTVDYCTSGGTINTNQSCVGGLVGRVYYKNLYITNNFCYTNLNLSTASGLRYIYTGQVLGWEPIASSGGENTVNIKNNYMLKVSKDVSFSGQKMDAIGYKSSYSGASYSIDGVKEYDNLHSVSISPELQGKLYISTWATEDKIYYPFSPSSEVRFTAFYNSPDSLLTNIKLTKTGSDDISREFWGESGKIGITLYGKDGYTLSEISTLPTSGSYSNGSTWRFDKSTLTMYVSPNTNGVAGPDSDTNLLNEKIRYLTKHAQIAPGTKKVGYRLFQQYRYLLDAKLPEGVEELDNISFNYCISLEEIKLPSSLKLIGDNVFTGCLLLDKVNLEDAKQLTSIGRSAFKQCSQLKYVVIPASVVNIGEGAFSEVPKLNTITFMHTGNMPQDGNYSLLNKSAFNMSQHVDVYTQNGEMAYQLMNRTTFDRNNMPDADYHWNDSLSVYKGDTLQVSTDADLHTFIAFIKGRKNPNIKAKLLADFNLSNPNIVEDFSGTLDGNGHTISGLRQPLFPSIYNATIEKLRIEGSISGGNTPNIGSLACIADGTNKISEVMSTVSLSSTLDSAAYYGGLIGKVKNGTTTISYCLYRGAMSGKVAPMGDTGGAPRTTYFGGMVGENNGTLNINFCVSKPTSVAIDDYYATFCWNDKTFHLNQYSYYFDDMAGQSHIEKQGILGSGMTTDQLVNYVDPTSQKTIWGIDSNDEPTLKLFTNVTWRGSGDANNPFKIKNVDDLKLFITKLSKNYTFEGKYIQLDSDLELNNTTISGYGQDFNSMNSGFMGTFDGKGHTIKNLTINNKGQNYQGLIRKMGEGGTMKNLFLYRPTITGSNFVGTLVGQAAGGTIENCIVEEPKVASRDGKNGGSIVGAKVDAVTSTKNYYFNPQNDVKGVGTDSGSEDMLGAEQALEVWKDKNITSISPVTSDLFIQPNGSLLAPVRLATFQIDVNAGISNTSSRNVVYSANGADIVKDENDSHFTLTPNADFTGKVKVQANHTSIWQEGYGSAQSPYQIASADDLLAIATKVNNVIEIETYRNQYFKLVADIDMTDVEDFVPIGYSNTIPFSGNFDGDGHVITGMHFTDSTSARGIGLFGNLSEYATVQNLTLLRPTFTGKSYVGAIAGRAKEGAIIKNNFVVDAHITATDENWKCAGILVGSGAAYTDNYYHRLENDPIPVFGDRADDAHVMYTINPADSVALSNIQAEGTKKVKYTVKDTVVYYPFRALVRLDVIYKDSSDASFLKRFTDGCNNDLTRVGDETSNTWQFNIQDSANVIITPTTTTLSGYCGQGTGNEKTVRYRFDSSNNTLYFEGTGAIKNFGRAGLQPWYKYEDVDTIRVGEGITKIGNYAFCSSKARAVFLPSTLASIGASSMRNMVNLRKITLPANVSIIDANAFSYCTNLQSIALPQCDSVPTIGKDILYKTNNDCAIHVPNMLLSSFKENLSSYASRFRGFAYPADKVTLTASMSEPVVISANGVIPATVDVSAVIKEPVTVTFNETEGHSFTFDEFSEKKPFVVLKAQGVSTKPAQGKTSVSLDGGKYALDIFDKDSYGDYDHGYDDSLGVVYANNYKVALTPQEGKVTMLDGTTSKDNCNTFFVEKDVQGLVALTIDDTVRVSYATLATPVVARDTLYFPQGTQIDLTYTPKKTTYNGDYWEKADDPMGDDQFVAFRANAVKGRNYYGAPFYGLSSAEMDYVDATHSTLTLFDEDAYVHTELMNRSDEVCDIVPEKGEIFFHTTRPDYDDRFGHYDGGSYRWDKAAHLVKTIYFEDQIEKIPHKCFSYMDRLEEVYFLGKKMPTFENVSDVLIGCERAIYVPEDTLSGWKKEYIFSYDVNSADSTVVYHFVHGELLPIPATTIEGMAVTLTVDGDTCTIYQAANDETQTPEVLGGTYEFTYDGYPASEHVKSSVFDGGFELDDTKHYSLRAFRVGDDEDRDGTDIHYLKDAGTYRLKVVGTRFHKGAIDLCNLVIKQAPFENITYAELPSRYLYPNDPRFSFEYGWMDDDFNYLYDTPFYYNGEPLYVYHYGPYYTWEHGYQYGSYDFELIYSDNDHVGQAGLTLKSRNHNFTEGEHTLYFTLYGDNYEGEWGDLVWDITQGVLTIKPKEGLAEASMEEAQPVEGYDGYNQLKVYPWFQTYYDNGYKNEHHNSILTINVCEGVTNIAADAFCDGNYADGFGEYRYKSLKTINIPASVTTIGKRAFDSKYVKNIVFAHNNGVAPLAADNIALPNRDNFFIWVDGNRYDDYIADDVWKEYKDQIVPAYADIEVSSAGMRTYSLQFPLDFTQQTALSGQTSPLKAYVATSKYDSDASELTFTAITDVPAATGLLLKGGEGTYRVPTHISDATVQNNLLTAVLKDTVVKAKPSIWQEDTDGKWRDVDYVNFILADGQQGVGFYPLTEDGTITANKAYLTIRDNQLPANLARGIRLIFDDDDQTVDIESPDTAIREMDYDVWYDLKGKRLSAKPTRSGLYIHNGKKIFVK